MKKPRRVILFAFCAVAVAIFSFAGSKTMKQAAALIEQAALSDREKLELQAQVDMVHAEKLSEVWPVLHLNYDIDTGNCWYNLQPYIYVIETKGDKGRQYFFYDKGQNRIPVPNEPSANYNEALTRQANNLREQAATANYQVLAWINVMNGYPTNGFAAGVNGGVAPIVWALCCDSRGNGFIYKDAFAKQPEFLPEKDFWRGVQRFVAASQNEIFYGGIIWN